MFRALKFRKFPTVLVRFPNESHELSRSGQPWHRVERLENIVGWFDHWLVGVPKPEYEVAKHFLAAGTGRRAIIRFTENEHHRRFHILDVSKRGAGFELLLVIKWRR